MSDLEGNIIAACEQLAAWHDKGRVLPGYVYKQGRPFIGHLVGIPYNYYSDHNGFRRAYHASGSTLVDNIIGPNGWVMLQVAIARKSKKEET